MTASGDENIPPKGISETAQGVEVIRAMVKTLPLSAGVYRMIGENDENLYIGKAKQLKARVSNYANLLQLPGRLQRMVMGTRRMEIIHTASEAEALLLEATLIKTHKPRYNILLRDDKSFPYIQISGHAFARISKYRGAKGEPGEYFGPFVSAGAVDATLALLQKAFMLRPCADTVFKNRTRPCLQFQIKKCSAPCVGAISEEDYGALISQAKQFLRGKGRDIQDLLARQMQQASERMDFEAAAGYRDRIKALTHVQQAAGYAATGVEDADVIALMRSGGTVCVQVFSYRSGSNYGSRTYFPAHADDQPEAEVMAAFIGQYYQRQPVPKQILLNVEPQEREVLESALALLAKRSVEITVPQRASKRTLLEQAMHNAREALARHLLESAQQTLVLAEVAELFDLAEPPARIEVYDNSHVMGTHAVGAMIVAGAEGFNKKAYRTYSIKSAETTPGDDYGMMREVLTRRFRKLADSADGIAAERPDLVLIDGGPGQLSTAREVFEQLGIGDIPLVAIAKGPERNAGREWFYLPGREPFQLPHNHSTLHYLQRLRDEAHRFAIGAHRNKRSSAIRQSELDAIGSIGPGRKRALLRHFGSAKGVSSASVQEIEQVAGISRELAKKIYAHFHGE